MAESKAFCPKCKQEAVFVRTGRLSTCSLCGFQYEMSEPQPLNRKREARSEVAIFFGLFVKVILIMAALVVIGVAVLFAGCAIALKGF